MADFNPANGLLSVGYETLRGINPTVWHDHKFVSEGLSNERERVEDDSIVNLAQAAESPSGKSTTDGPIAFILQPEGHYPYFNNVQGANSTTEPETGVFLHKFAPSEAGAAPATLGVRVNRDDDASQFFHEGYVNQLELTVERSNFLRCNVGMLFARGDYWSESTEIEDGATPNTKKPYFRGNPLYANWSLATEAARKHYFKITSIADIGTGVIQARAKVGAGAYGVAGTFDINIGLDANGRPVWSEVLDDNGIGLGPRDIPLEVFIEASTGYEVGDEYSFDPLTGVWTPSYPDVPTFNAVFAYILWDDAQFCARSVQMTLVRPVVGNDCFSGVFDDGISPQGARVVTWNIERKYLSIEHRLRLESGEPFKLRLEAYSGQEIDAGLEHFFSATSPRCIATGRTATINGRDDMPETIECQAFPDASNMDGYVDDVTFQFRNSVEDPDL